MTKFEVWKRKKAKLEKERNVQVDGLSAFVKYQKELLIKVGYYHETIQS